ncbi:MAG: type IX secretion system membrane protein PorP/SprF [Flavobacteriaceae bacterium]
MAEHSLYWLQGRADFIFQYRSQWNKLEGSPERLYLNYQKPGDNKLSYGISLLQEETGPMSQTTFGVDLAYIIQLSDSTFLSLGIKPMVDLLDVRFDQLNIYNPQDPWFSVNIYQMASPNVGFGLFYYDQGGYIGLSTTGILATKHFDQASPSSFSRGRKGALLLDSRKGYSPGGRSAI